MINRFISDSLSIEKLRGYIREGMTPNLSITVVSDSDTLFHFQEGSKSFENRDPIDADTQFNAGSTTKMITAALLVLLAESGEITLDDPIQRFIPEGDWRDATLNHLLTHTSGIRERNLGWPGQGRISELLTALYANRSWNSHPGEKFAYFTSGFTILMDVLERVTGDTIEAYAQRKLFGPLGMTGTTYDTSLVSADRYTSPCSPGTKDMSNHDRLATTGDSGLYSTASDLAIFGRMLLGKGKFDGKRICSEAAVDLMLRERTNGEFAYAAIGMMKMDAYSHGCFSDLNYPGTVGHPGYSGCMLWVDPQCGLAGAIVTNSVKLHEDWSHYRKLIAISMSIAMSEKERENDAEA